MVPDSGAVVARSARARVDFPEPVRPRSAVLVPALIVRETSCRAGSRCGE